MMWKISATWKNIFILAYWYSQKMNMLEEEWWKQIDMKVNEISVKMNK